MNATNGTPRTRGRTLRSDILFAFAVAVACYLAWLLRHVLLLLYVSALFAVVLKPLVCFISDLRFGRFRPFRKVAIFVLLLAVIGGLTAFGFVAIPPVVSDLDDFTREVPARLPHILDALRRIPFAGHINTDALTARVEGAITDSASYVLHSLKNWAGAIFSIAMCLILTVYFSLEGDTAYHWVLSLVPIDYRDRLDHALRRAEGRMGKWLLGQGTLMLILGLASTVTYLALHVRYAYALGFLTGLLNIIPVVGAAVCIALALLVAAVDSWGRVLGVAIFYAVYINLENSFLIPRIMKSRVDLPGLSILVGLLIGSEVAGVVGALVSVPTAVLVSVLLDEYLVVKDENPSVAVNTVSRR
ncbi:MAG TPA: AI-2E family transporter [Terracidiphilus sp.]|jgi:predicted PurR-regulated permease PerM|nr:AI-2E family transporter [Terracidiphilus sp.]